MPKVFDYRQGPIGDERIAGSNLQILDSHKAPPHSFVRLAGVFRRWQAPAALCHARRLVEVVRDAFLDDQAANRCTGVGAR